MGMSKMNDLIIQCSCGRVLSKLRSKNESGVKIEKYGCLRCKTHYGSWRKPRRFMIGVPKNERKETTN